MNMHNTRGTGIEAQLDAQLASESHTLALMDRLHKVFANAVDQDVDLSKLTIDDLGVSIELRDGVNELRDGGIDIIPAATNIESRRLKAYIAHTL